MPEQNDPRLIVTITDWSFHSCNSVENSWTLDERLAATKSAGFDAYCCTAALPNLKDLLTRHGLRFAGAFDTSSAEDFKKKIAPVLMLDNGPVNVQVADHDTSTEDATEIVIGIMEEAERLGVNVHLEMHRDTCTETPEKTYAIAEAYRTAKGDFPLINFDFSHPAVVKHLHPGNYMERLFEKSELFQRSNLWHMRPFNGHHCQIPVTDGRGGFSPEYLDMRDFIRNTFNLWLQGPRPNNELWIVPELGPKGGYGLSCFPNIWEDTVVLGKDLRTLWNEALNAST